MIPYYYRVFGEEFGPISFELLRREIECGQLSGADEIRCWNETHWTRVADFIVQGLANQTPAAWTTHSILRWDGGHDDIEVGETAYDVSVRKTVDQWFCRSSRLGGGPYTFDELRLLARSGELAADDEVSLREHGPWTNVGSIWRLTEEMFQPLAANTSRSSSGQKTVADVAFEPSVPISAEQRPKSDSAETETQWYARMGRIERGPMEFQKLIEMAAAGHILPTDGVRPCDQSEWTIAHAIPGLFSPFSHSNQTGSTHVLTTRPSPTLPIGFGQRVYSPRPARISPATSASVQAAMPPVLPFVSTSPTYSISLQPDLEMGPTDTESSASQRLVSRAELPRESGRQTIEAESQIPQSQRGENLPADVQHSAEQLNSRPPHLVNGESKHKLRRGQFREPQLLDRKNLIGAASVGVVMLLFLGWRMLPVSIDKFEEPYLELTAIYQVLDEKWSEKPTMELWAFTRKEVVYKIESVKQKIKNLNSHHEIRNFLLFAGDRMIWAAKANSSDDVKLNMHDARGLLDASWKELQKEKQKNEKQTENSRQTS